jgi:hypothetical protein
MTPTDKGETNMNVDLPSNKVYCSNCEFYDAYTTTQWTCDHLNATTTEDTPVCVRKIHTSAAVRNANNDCPDFKQVVSWYRREMRTDMNLKAMCLFGGIIGSAIIIGTLCVYIF